MSKQEIPLLFHPSQGQKYIDILRKEEGYTVLTYEAYFFRCTDLVYLDPDAKQLAKDHILSRLQKDSSPSILIALEGLSNQLDKDEVEMFVDPPIKVIISTSPEFHTNLATSRLHEATGLSPDGNRDIKNAVLTRLDDWILHYDGRGGTDVAETLRKLKSDIEFPF